VPAEVPLNSCLLRGVKVLDLAGEPLAMTGRMLADMGAEVVKLEPAGGDPLRRAHPLSDEHGISLRFLAWNAGKISLECDPDDPHLDAVLRGADVVIQTPGFAGALQLDPDRAPQAVWLMATPFGLRGPRAKWRASDLGLMAAAGNLYATGYPDRPPVRCTEPAGYAHAGAEATFAILTALASGRPQVIDLSMQEVAMIASMSGAGQFPRTGRRGERQGASLAGTREIWPCKDGYVSFGLRGGPARLHNFRILTEQMEREGLLTPAWADRDWTTFSPWSTDGETLRSIEQPLARYFLRHTMTELYQLSVATNLMLAPANSAVEILGNEQLASRDMFLPVGGIEKFPARFFLARDLASERATVAAPSAATTPQDGPWPEWHAREETDGGEGDSRHAGAWAGLKLLEFGAGAAGPIACRYFIEQGATVIRVESNKHPDFLRVMAAGSPHGMEGSTLFDALNVGKQSITLNLKHPEGKRIALQLMQWSDAVLENFAPRAMKSYGLDYASVAPDKPDLIMLSTCLNGQTGPHKDYPGFGGQGAALSGFNFLTGWPDREPIGPFGTITDSLAPRFGASALAAALLYRRRTGRGLHIDLSQVETGVYSLSPWLLEYGANGHCRNRSGNRNDRAAPHGVFPCQGDERWIAIACWSDHEWLHLATILGLDAGRFPDQDSRLAAQDEIEQSVAEVTHGRDAEDLAKQLQYAGVEAVPVADFQDLLERDPQLAYREHFVHLKRQVTGDSIYERNGFRLSAAASGFTRASPLLGEHTDEILTGVLGYDDAEVRRLKESGAID
jgi:crotonobetainyl-CoA:carnitine CoA-transferase CaiB-like acyl-CoA transferase